MAAAMILDERLTEDTTEQICNYLINYNLAEKIVVGADCIWKITKETGDNDGGEHNPFYRACREVTGYSRYLIQVLKNQFPALEFRSFTCRNEDRPDLSRDWVVLLVVSVARDLAQDWEVYEDLALKLGGDPPLGNFKGTIRIEETGIDAEVLATHFYETVKQFCWSCTCTVRPLKSGGSSIFLVAGKRKVYPVVSSSN